MDKTIKYIIGITLFLTLFSAVYDRLSTSISLTYLFSLSLSGVKNFFLWQFFTHPFLIGAPQGITPSLLLNLGFSLYLFAKISSLLSAQKGVKHLIALCLGSALFSGLAAFLTLYITPSPSLFGGPGPILFTLLVATVVLYPDLELLIFFTIPAKAKWLVLIILSSLLLIDLSNSLFVSFFAYLTAFLFGYFYATTVWSLKSPFPGVQSLQDRLSGLYKKPSLDPYLRSSSKIYDFKTGERIISDEEFLDGCLTKIEQEGRHSLTLRERLRLYRLSKKERKALISK